MHKNIWESHLGWVFAAVITFSLVGIAISAVYFVTHFTFR